MAERLIRAWEADARLGVDDGNSLAPALLKACAALREAIRQRDESRRDGLALASAVLKYLQAAEQVRDEGEVIRQMDLASAAHGFAEKYQPDTPIHKSETE